MKFLETNEELDQYGLKSHDEEEKNSFVEESGYTISLSSMEEYSEVVVYVDRSRDCTPATRAPHLSRSAASARPRWGIESSQTWYAVFAIDEVICLCNLRWTLPETE